MLIASLVAAAAPASALGADPLLPDLVADRAERLRLSADPIPGDSVPHLLLRFDSLVHNIGPGVLEVHGRDPQPIGDSIEMAEVEQRAYAGAWPDGKPRVVEGRQRPVVYYEDVEGHAHFHLADIAHYVLTAVADPAVNTTYAKSRAGFCLLDKERAEGPLGPPFYTADLTGFCQEDNPTAPDVLMGILPGWRDRYTRELPFQWVDATNVQPGHYTLNALADPTDVIVEANELNNAGDASTAAPVTIPGYRARSMYVRTFAGAPASIALDAERFESQIEGAEPPGPAEFAIVDPPERGVLVGAPERWFAPGTVLYVPEAGYEGVDSFSYAARDQDHPLFPRAPAVATVTVRVGRTP